MGQALDLQFPRDGLQHPSMNDPFGPPHEMKSHHHGDLPRHVHLVEVDVGDGVGHRVILHVLDQDEPAVEILGGGLEPEHVRALQPADAGPQFPAVHLHGDAVGPPAVDDPRKLSVAPQAPGVALVADLSRLYRNFYRFQT